MRAVNLLKLLLMSSRLLVIVAHDYLLTRIEGELGTVAGLSLNVACYAGTAIFECFRRCSLSIA